MNYYLSYLVEELVFDERYNCRADSESRQNINAEWYGEIGYIRRI